MEGGEGGKGEREGLGERQRELAWQQVEQLTINGR